MVAIKFIVEYRKLLQNNYVIGGSEAKGFRLWMRKRDEMVAFVVFRILKRSKEIRRKRKLFKTKLFNLRRQRESFS